MIRFKNLTKRFADGKGIFDFSFEVEAGEVFGLIGSGMAGKTTAFRLLMGFEEPTKGRCAINGKDCRHAARQLHRMIGFLPDNFSLSPVLTGRQFLLSLAQMRGMRNLERLFDISRKLDLDLDAKIGAMRSANVQKVGILAALMHDPPVVLLDNPFRNLDSKSRSAMVDIILEEKERGKMVLLSSDQVDAADLTCDRVGLLDKGNLLYLGDIESMRENMYRNYLVQFDSARGAMQFSKEPFEVKSMKDRNLVVSVRGELLPLVRALANYHVTSIEPVPLSLEETFKHIYGGVLHV